MQNGMRHLNFSCWSSDGNPSGTLIFDNSISEVSVRRASRRRARASHLLRIGGQGRDDVRFELDRFLIGNVDSERDALPSFDDLFIA